LIKTAIMKKIGILGSGIVARTLGSGFLKNGYTVMLGTRDPGKLAEWISGHGPTAMVGSFAEAAGFGDMLVLAVKGTVAQNVLDLAGPTHLIDKTIIDATNPISSQGPDHGVLKFTTSLDRSLMEDLQTCFPQARFVKAFNSVGSAHMVDPAFDEKPTMFICGNDPQAKAEVSKILTEFGWEAADFGGAESARAIEPLCILWCIPGFLHNNWSHAFRWLTR
jgi:predicted dinucleotide-binding enzyme